jgi:hypothetical protein
MDNVYDGRAKNVVPHRPDNLLIMMLILFPLYNVRFYNVLFALPQLSSGRPQTNRGNIQHCFSQTMPHKDMSDTITQNSQS